jgi:hypothetical protein
MNDYVRHLSVSDLHARKASKQEEYLQRYNNIKTLDLTVKQLELLQRSLRIAENAMRTHMPRFRDNHLWTLKKTDSSIEGGMPHTHGQTIYFSDTLLREGTDPHRVAEVLVHEKVHVLQRAYPQCFEDLYVNVLGYTKYQGWSINRPLRRTNPDIFGSPDYIYADAIVITEYEDEKPADLHDSRLTAYDPKTGQKKQMDWEWLRGELGNAQQIEHPNEVSACLIAHVVMEMNNKDISKLTSLHQRIYSWLSREQGNKGTQVPFETLLRK